MMLLKIKLISCLLCNYCWELSCKNGNQWLPAWGKKGIMQIYNTALQLCFRLKCADERKFEVAVSDLHFVKISVK